MAQAQPASLFRAVMRLYKPHLPAVVGLTALMLGVRGLNVAYPKLLEMAIDVADEGASYRGLGLGTVASITGGAVLLHAILAFGSGRVREALGVQVVAELRQAVFAKLIHQRPAWYQRNPPAELVSRLGGDGGAIAGLTMVVASVFGEVCQTLAALALMLSIDPRMTLLSLATIPVIGGLSALIARALRRYSESARTAEARANAHAQRTLDAVETVQSYRREDSEQLRYRGFIREILAAEFAIATWSGAFNGLLALGTGIPFLVVVWFGGRSIAAGAASPGSVAAFLMYLVIVSNSVRSLADSWGALQRTLGQSAELFKLSRLSVPELGGGASVGAGDAQRLVMEGVSFAYPEAPLDPAVQEVWLQVEKGQCLALVGRSGAGKSTITKLLMRFREPTFGRILIDGVDASTIRLDDYRTLIGFVPQSPALFPGTVAENIAYGEPGASEDEIVEAAKRAHADQFIRRLPDGYATDIGEHGSRLSGGQRQRVALARALLLRPPFLILDEVTSHLDAESESAIERAMTELAREHAILVIAHRLNTVRRADEILVMDRGRIVEVGDHETLMRQNKVYRRLAELQMHETQLEAEVTGVFQGSLELDEG